MYYPSYEDYMRDVFYFNGLTNHNMMYSMQNTTQNLNNMYPSIYNIINPVIQKVVAGNNYQFVNEDAVNNIVDVVLGITIGDINNLEVNNNDSRKGNNCQNNNSSSQVNNVYAQDNTLLRDLIKILTIKELSSRNNIRRFPYSYGAGYYMNNQMLM